MSEIGSDTVVDLHAGLAELNSDLRRAEESITATARRAHERAASVLASPITLNIVIPAASIQGAITSMKQGPPGPGAGVTRGIQAEAAALENLDRTARRTFATINQGGGALSPERTGARSLLDTTIRLGAVIKIAEIGAKGFQIATELSKASTAEIEGNLRKSAQHSANAARMIQSLPVVGNILEALSNDAAGKAQKSLEDADKLDQKTGTMVRDRTRAEEALGRTAAQARAEAIGGVSGQIAAEKVRHEQSITTIRQQQEDRKIGANAAKDAIDAENALHQQKLVRLETDRAIADQESRNAAALLDPTQGNTLGFTGDEDRLRRRAELEGKLAIDVMRAEKEGHAEAERARADAATQMAEFEKGLAREIEDERRAAAEQRLAQAAGQAEALHEMDMRHVTEQREAERTAQRLRFEGRQSLLQAAQQDVRAQFETIQSELRDVIEEKGRDTIFGRPLQDPAVIAAAQARAEDQAKALFRATAAQVTTFDAARGSAVDLTGRFTGSDKIEDLAGLQREAIGFLNRIATAAENPPPPRAA